MAVTEKTFESLALGVDYEMLNGQLKALAELKETVNVNNHAAHDAIEGLLNFMGHFCDTVVATDTVPENYVRPEEGLTIVTWPESQNYMEHPRFEEEAILINDDYGLEKCQSSAYWIPNDIIEEVDNQNTVPNNE